MPARSSKSRTSRPLSQSGSQKKSATTNRKPLWDWTKGITQSALAEFVACREQFSLDYIEGITPKGFSVPLEFGTMIHLAIQQTEEITAGKTTAEEVIVGVVSSYHNARFPNLSRMDQDSLVKTCAAAEMLFPEYYKTTAEDDAKQKWVQREQRFEIPYPIELNGGMGTATINLRGMRDGVYRTKRHDMLGLYETKTKSQIDDNAVTSGLRADLQTLFYLTTLWIETGERPREVLYNVIRRPGQKFLDKDTYKTFKDRIKKDIQSRPEHYFRRWEVNVLESDLLQFRSTVLNPTLYQLYQWWGSVKDNPFDRFRSPYHYVNLNALYNKYGNSHLYNWMVLGRKRDYYVRSLTFPELDAAA